MKQRQRKPASVLALVLVIITVGGIGEAVESYPEAKIINSILESYNVDARPVLNNSEPVSVGIAIALRQLMEMEERHELLKTNVWLRLYWTDRQLSWNESEFDGVQAVRIFPTKIWRPDIILHNEITQQQQDLGDIYPATVSSKGDVMWLTKHIYKSSCPMDVSDFPWDIQECNLTFGSWTYGIDGIDLISLFPSADTTVFSPNGEWVLKGVPAKREMVDFPCCEDPFPLVNFTIIISRKPLYYIVTLLIPFMCITLVGAMVFCLPADSGEKVSLSVTVLLSTTVFLLILSNSLPVQSNVVPRAGKFFMAVIIVMSSCTIFTVVVLCIENRGKFGSRVPALIRKVCLRRFGQVVQPSASNSSLAITQEEDQQPSTLNGRPSVGSGFYETTPIPSFTDGKKCRSNFTKGNQRGRPASASSSNSLVMPHTRVPRTNGVQKRSKLPTYTEFLLEHMSATLDTLAQQRRAAENRETINEEWVYLAFLLDRSLLVVFLLAMTLTGVFVLWLR